MSSVLRGLGIQTGIRAKGQKRGATTATNVSTDMSGYMHKDSPFYMDYENEYDGDQKSAPEWLQLFVKK